MLRRDDNEPDENKRFCRNLGKPYAMTMVVSIGPCAGFTMGKERNIKKERFVVMRRTRAAHFNQALFIA